MLAPIFFSIITFIAIVLICAVIYFIWQKKEDIKEQSIRFEQAVNIQTQPIDPKGSKTTNENQEQGDSNLRRDTRISTIPWLNNLLSKSLKEKAKSLMILIEQSGLKVRVSEFLLFSFLIAFGSTLLIDLFFHIPLVGFALGLAPYLILNILKAKRIEAFIGQMPQALDMLSGDLRAGVDVQAGLKHLADEFGAPIGEEFGKVVAEINLGLTINEALNNLASRINSTEVQILCTGIIINRELGGNLSELIGSVANTVRERFRLKGIIKALTAENQMSGYLLIALPFALYFILNLLAPETYGTFLSDPRGKQIITSCLISMTLGYLIMNKITKLEV